MIGSLDHIEDALDSLRKEDCVYLLVIGRPGEFCTRVYSNLKGNYNQEAIDKIIEAGRECLEIEVEKEGE